MFAGAGGFYVWTLHEFKSCHFAYTKKIDNIENKLGGFGLVMNMLESGSTHEIKELMVLKQQRDDCRQYYWQQ